MRITWRRFLAALGLILASIAAGATLGAGPAAADGGGFGGGGATGSW